MVTMIRILLSLLLLLLDACSLPLPRPHVEIAPPKATRTGVKIVHSTNDLSQVRWWKKMHDPILNQLIQEALVKNNQIHTAEANIRQAEAKLKEARFAWLPTLSLSGNGFVGGGWDSQFTPQNPLTQSLALSQLRNIHFKGYYSGFVPNYSLNIMQNINKAKLAKASLRMQMAEYQSARLSIISQISGSYFMLLGQKEQLIEQAKYLCDLKELRHLEWVRYEKGASDLSTITTLDRQIADSQASLAAIENSIFQVENAIQVLINRNPGPIVTSSKIKNLPTEGIIPANIPSQVLKNRPDVIMAQQNLNISESNLGLAYSNFFPTISLTGMLGGASLQLAHLLKLSTGLWIAQAAAAIPILNGVTYEQIIEAKAGYCATYFNYLQTIKSVFADVDNSLTNQQKLKEAYQAKLNALKAANQAYALSSAKYQAGAKDYRELVNAKLLVDSARQEANLAKMQLLDSIVQVYQALAGGYGESCYDPSTVPKVASRGSQ